MSRSVYGRSWTTLRTEVSIKIFPTTRWKTTMEKELIKEVDLNIILFLLTSHASPLLRVRPSGDSLISLHLASRSHPKIYQYFKVCFPRLNSELGWGLRFIFDHFVEGAGRGMYQSCLEFIYIVSWASYWTKIKKYRTEILKSRTNIK